MFFFAPEFKSREGKGRGQYMRSCNMYETEAIIAALYISPTTLREPMPQQRKWFELQPVSARGDDNSHLAPNISTDNLS